MRQGKIILLLINVLFITGCSAQPLKVIKATSQRWSGGVVGRYGINYSIQIETSKKTIVPDTIWINGKTYPIDFSTRESNCKRTFDSITGETTYAISVGEAHNNMFRGRPSPVKDTATETQKPTRKFEGAALISYSKKINHASSGRQKQYYFIIKSFTVLNVLNYP